ncbi:MULTISPECIES: DegT/DnrJ/EryC1/StrS family aminotransferase [Micromonospora]|uniref:DegT/DnrJ/EryC1/StrS family aminotransferase n=1 Tax=Micromonospora TaxID=1873 RepID=UPI00064B8707|nr:MULTISPECIES: DegT/DnrJ/EryC1/StrS family aminotransferase [Micromonospora]MDG4750892.1 DegT/DnrJ/EryC1/StrS family aminotransferase [Micromonospora sp. WMMD718]UFN96871.1 DegT/DnrJ/EryC1/StrS family aminotransferase [Micromonospora aurantiaca]
MQQAWRTQARPYLGSTEQAAVQRAMSSPILGRSPETERFEQRLGELLDNPYAVAVSSGTMALYLAVASCISPGQEVLVPSYTFCATVQAVLAAGGVPRFVDVDPQTLAAGPREFLARWTDRTRAVVPVFFAGAATDLSGLDEVAASSGATVVVDAAHAFGTRDVGNGEHLTCFSFDPIKNITTGDGGAVMARDEAEYRRLMSMQMLGISEQRQEQRWGVIGYEVTSFGFRSHLQSINAAIGLAQLDRFADIRARRQSLWQQYAEALRGTDEVQIVPVDISRTVPFNFVVMVPGRDRVHARLRDQGIGVAVHYPPNHRQPAFRQYHDGPLPVTERVWERVLSLPFHPAMDANDVDHVVTALRAALPSHRPRTQTLPMVRSAGGA